MENDNSEISEVEIALVDNPYNIQALCKLGQWLAQQQDIQGACEVYNKIVRLDYQNQRAWIALGHCNLLNERYQSSYSAYQTALLHQPNNAYLWFGIAALYQKFNRLEFAKKAFKNVLKIDRFFEFTGEVNYNLGLIYKEKAKFEKAVESFRRSLQPFPPARKIEVLRHIGQCYENLHLYQDAYSAYQEALEIDPRNYKTIEYQGWCLFLEKKYELAIEVYHQALEAAGDDLAEIGDLHYLIGRSFFEMKQHSNARLAFENALKNNQNAGVYWWSTAVLYEIVGKRGFAIQFLRKALNLDRDNGELWFLLGTLYERNQMIVEAAEAYQFAVENEFETAIEYLNSVGEGKSLPEIYHPIVSLSNHPFSVELFTVDDDFDDAGSEDFNTEATSSPGDTDQRDDDGCNFQIAWHLLNRVAAVIQQTEVSNFIPLRRGPSSDCIQPTQKVRRI